MSARLVPMLLLLVASCRPATGPGGLVRPGTPPEERWPDHGWPSTILLSVDGHVYYARDDAGRRALGLPWVDTRVYSQEATAGN